MTAQVVGIMGDVLGRVLKCGSVAELEGAYSEADKEMQTRLTVALVCVENKLEKFGPLSTTEGCDPIRP